MIRYTVLWREQAEGELAELWSHAPRRNDITAATDILDSELQNDAHQKGFELPSNLRVMARSLLTIYFRIDEADRKVFVEAVRLTESN